MTINWQRGIMLNTKSENSINNLNDIFNSNTFATMFNGVDGSSMIVNQDLDKNLDRTSFVASKSEAHNHQRVCHDFEDYQYKLEKALSDIQCKPYKKVTTKESDIKIDDVFVFTGIIGCVVALNKSEDSNTGQSIKAHVVYMNGTESHISLASLVLMTQKHNNYLVRFEPHTA